MITLAGEIFYHKHKQAIDEKLAKWKPGKKTKVETMNYQNKALKSQQTKGRITLGENDFNNYRSNTNNKMMPRVSYISVFPRNPQPPYD